MKRETQKERRTGRAGTRERKNELNGENERQKKTKKREIGRKQDEER